MKLYLIRFGSEGPGHTAYVLANEMEDLKRLTESNSFIIWKSEILATLNRNEPSLLIDLTDRG
jgi:hypothetical protein